MLRGIRSFNEGTLPLRVARSGTKRPKYGRLVPTAPQHLLINLRIPRNRRRLLVRFACSAFSVLMRFVGNGFLVSMHFCLQRLLGFDTFCRQRLLGFDAFCRQRLLGFDAFLPATASWY